MQALPITRVHHTKGRLRVCWPVGRHFPEVYESIASSITKLDGVVRSRVRPRTGSIILYYDEEQTNFEMLMSEVAEEIAGIYFFPIQRKNIQSHPQSTEKNWVNRPHSSFVWNHFVDMGLFLKKKSSAEFSQKVFDRCIEMAFEQALKFLLKKIF